MQLDLDTLDIFGGKISENGNLYFLGAEENSWQIIFPDLTIFETQNFYTMIYPNQDIFVQDIFFFRNVKEAMIFFKSKKVSYFISSLLIICGKKSHKYVKASLFLRYFKERKVFPKLHFYHSPENFELVSLYLELLDKGIYSESVINDEKSFLKIHYQDIRIHLNFNQISKSKIGFLLGINDRKFSVKNHFLSHTIIHQHLNW